MKKGLVVMGSQDHIFFRSAKRFTEIQKNMRLAVIENCGRICAARPLRSSTTWCCASCRTLMFRMR